MHQAPFHLCLFLVFVYGLIPRELSWELTGASGSLHMLGWVLSCCSLLKAGSGPGTLTVWCQGVP